MHIQDMGMSFTHNLRHNHIITYLFIYTCLMVQIRYSINIGSLNAYALNLQGEKDMGKIFAC